MIRNIVAVVVGLIVAIALVWALQTFSHSVYPPPPGLDLSNPEQLGQFVNSMPPNAFLLVIASYALGTLIGGLTACFIGRSRPYVFATAIGVFVLLGMSTSIMTIPHPLWFTVSAILSIFAMIWLAARLSMRFVKTDPE